MMNEFQNRIDRRPNARITRSALDEVKAIQTLLADVYKDIGGGRTLLRELVQNADDAKASRLIFVVVESGWAEAHNSLLHGPALLVANDGAFPVADRDALHQAIGGSKAADLEKVGRFGMGLKSVFHICEAFVYLGAEHGVLRPGAVNPWAGTGGAGDADPLHPDWDVVDDEDLQRILEIARTLFGSFEAGFLQWIPLRRDVHLNRAPDRLYGLGQFRPQLDEVAAWFGQSSAMALLLAQCGHLQSIEAYRVAPAKGIADRTQLAGVMRPNFQRCSWVQRYDQDAPLTSSHFEGQIDAGDRAWLVVGMDAHGADSLRQIREQPDWPSEPHSRGGQCVWLPRKALAHAAITIVRPRGRPAEQVAACLRWAVFFPLDDDPNPRNSGVVETLGCGTEGDRWDMILHGYFWPSHDRRSIPGVTDDDPGTGDAVVRARWNRAVRDDLLLPLLPSVLAKAVESVPEATARTLLKAVAQSRTVTMHLQAVCRREVLLPVLARGGVAWQVRAASGVTILSVPCWSQVPQALQEAIVARTSSEEIVFIDDDAPRIGGETSPWPAFQWEKILSCVSAEVLQTPDVLVWTQRLLQHVLGKVPAVSDERAAVAARWLAMRIGEDVLAGKTAPASGKPREEPRALWRRLFETLPAAWLVDVPVGSQPAVVELARKGVVGPGLVPIPFGRRPGPERPRPDRQYLDRALRELGKALQGSEGTTRRTQQARLLLAESLLSVRGDLRFEQDLERLPLLRARRLPDDRDEAWSLEKLRAHVSGRCVFCRSSADDEEADRSLEEASDPKRAVEHLAKAIGKPAWLVDATVGAVAGVPTPTEEALADAVLRAGDVESPAEDRVDLLKRLSRDGAGASSSNVELAIRTLLTGRVAEAQKKVELFYVRSEDSRKEANQRTLQILLRLMRDSWRAVDAILVEPLPHGLVQDLRVKAVDEGVFQGLLTQCLQQQVEWDELCDEEVLHLLEQLHGNSPAARENWRAMPLHRDHRGSRGPIDDRTYRVGHLLPPPELEPGLRLLAPDPRVAHLYAEVPIFDHDGRLRAMLKSSAPERFADAILRALRSEEERSVVLPRDPELLELLRETAWLPGRANGAPVAPAKLLLLPKELYDLIAPLAEARCLGDRRLATAVDPAIWESAEVVVRELIKRPETADQLEQLSTALETDELARVRNGAYLVFTDAARLTTALIENALQSPLCSAHQGWALLSAATQALGIRGTPLDKAPERARKALVSLARRLCGPLPAEKRAAILNALATATPAHDSPTYRLFCTLFEAFCEDTTFLKDVVPQLAALPTQDGQWHKPAQIARSASGVAPRHLLETTRRKCLGLDSDWPAYQKNIASPTDASGADTADVLKRYFEPWRNKVPPQAIGLFLSLLGARPNSPIRKLAQHWLGEDVNIDGILDRLSTDLDLTKAIRVLCSGCLPQQGPIEALNLLGEWVEMEAEPDSETIFAVDPQLLDHWRGYFWKPELGDIDYRSSRDAASTQTLSFWHIQLRDVKPQQRTTHELQSLLRATVEWWAVRVLKLDPLKVSQTWARDAESSQTQVRPVRASILAHLPLTLRQLDVRESKPLEEALRNAERAQRTREQAPDQKMKAAMDAERSALEKLAQLVCEKGHQPFLLGRVRELMKRLGYRWDSVLRELAQNADDALAQAAEIAGGPLPDSVRRLTIRVHRVGRALTVDIIHYGRPINDTGGPAFPEGKARQWDQDLYFMMLLNLSTKPGEMPGQATAASTTGRFGLGFKSVHLVSDCPSVVSGFLAFSIAGGLLPQEQSVPNDPELAPVDGHRPTRIRLPLRNDVAEREVINGLCESFVYTRALLPAFARQVREVVVDGGPHPGVGVFDGEPIEDAAGWACSKTPVALPRHGQWRILRFRPQDITTTGELAKPAKKAKSAGAAKLLDTARGSAPAGTAAVVVGLREGMPTALPPDLPFLWYVTPTSEAWACGYAINGPFKLDPGRTHVSLEDPETLRVVSDLGEVLGNGLVALQQALLNGTTSGASLTEEPARFLEQLWFVLTQGLNSEDQLRREILMRLHGSGHGVSKWMSDCSVVPSRLPTPFAQRLPALRECKVIEVACDARLRCVERLPALMRWCRSSKTAPLSLPRWRRV